jgi:hypothetical protein
LSVDVRLWTAKCVHCVDQPTNHVLAGFATACAHIVPACHLYCIAAITTAFTAAAAAAAAAAYHNISNIILHISRQGSQQQPAVLLVAHHDSPVGSPGGRRALHLASALFTLAT